MCPFKVGDFVKHELGWVGWGQPTQVRMFICAVRKQKDYPLVAWKERLEQMKFPIGCRWWNEGRKRFQLEWFAVQELELWKD